MAPPNPKRPPRPPRPPGTQAPKDSDVELPFDDDEVDPLRADDPRPQRVPQFPAGSRRSRRQGSGRESNDRELAPRFDWAHEYSDPGHPPAFLYVERGPGVGQLVPVKQGPLVMGRSSSSELRLQHPSISRRHAQLTRRADRFFLKDLSSQNGTFLNRNRVTAEAEVMPGDEISMGNALLRLRGPGGTPALGVPIVTATNTLPDGGKKGLGTLGIALIAAAVGSAVAALVTVIAVNFGGSDADIPPAPGGRANPSTSVTQLASMEARPEATGTEFQAKRGSDAHAGAPMAGPSVEASGAQAPASGEALGNAAAEALAAPGEAPRTPASGAVEAAPGEAPRTTASGEEEAAAHPVAADSPASAEARTPAVRIEVSPGPSAMDVARGVAKLERSETGPSAHDVAAGDAKGRAGTVSPAEAAVLKRYAAGEVSAARERARAAKLNALYSQLARFEYAEAESRKAQQQRDLSGAITHLTTAVTVDEALTSGRSRHGPQLRKRLADLHVQSGTEHGKAGRVDQARAAFEQALKYDANHREARELLARLSAAADP
ncbi:FHA domain-containing protein [Pyxidicoccus sp. MSG2]|uniref:FHA domain-containing protein n=1 Tax=Pyxidicoccus sp. MSG2 TaxID=2996790 RepID=UPI00226FEB9C|nr:FHA domain-containing protein [Pyxidicoccus sp. MSG2]MCY1015262.1 FHA domain-containing protein [Pyxidicoccus sp. MSG2]